MPESLCAHSCQCDSALLINKKIQSSFEHSYCCLSGLSWNTSHISCTTFELLKNYKGYHYKNKYLITNKIVKTIFICKCILKLLFTNLSFSPLLLLLFVFKWYNLNAHYLSQQLYYFICTITKSFCTCDVYFV